MKLPSEVPVMTLPHATLLPQAFLPLYIFEPRYRQMLRDSLGSARMFSVAMQKPGRIRETPSPVAGLGLIRGSVEHEDGTSHLLLQGIARVELVETVRYKPYRVQRIRPLESPPSNDVAVDALLAKVRELLDDRVKLGLSFCPTFLQDPNSPPLLPGLPPAESLEFLDQVTDPGQVADLVSGAVLASPAERQTILETVHLESRLKHLIHFLMAEIRRKRKDTSR
ncbi:MAG TPA: LON peptidase substrate-binding domain-containing protein [Verrucomicrobiae bacterium]|jgi:Lon protease-like protein|nr:LON peptidase substrate-binding domain-containing protein [Verrucomicrobiae bacterium]